MEEAAPLETGTLDLEATEALCAKVAVLEVFSERSWYLRAFEGSSRAFSGDCTSATGILRPFQGEYRVFGSVVKRIRVVYSVAEILQ